MLRTLLRVFGLFAAALSLAAAAFFAAVLVIILMPDLAESRPRARYSAEQTRSICLQACAAAMSRAAPPGAGLGRDGPEAPLGSH